MTRMAFALIIFCAHAAASAETWITVNEIGVRLRSSTSCTQLSKNNLGALCDCCLVKNVDVDGVNAVEAIDRCNLVHRCLYPRSAYIKLAEARKVVTQSRRRLKSLTVMDLAHLSSPLDLPDDGMLTADNVDTIINALIRDNLLNLPHDLKFVTKKLSANTKGMFSGQLFFVGYEKSIANVDGVSRSQTMPLYILKETKKGTSEIGHLYKMNASKLRHERVDTNEMHFGAGDIRSRSMARIAFDDVHFKIHSGNETRYFSLLQTAPGKSFNKHLHEFGALAKKSEGEHNEEFRVAFTKMKHAFYRIGFAMSKLHQKYADENDTRYGPLRRTYVHGDLHSENVFYDDKTDTVTLIDNETFALSLKRPSLGVDDIVEFYVLHTMKTVAHRATKQLTNNRDFGINDDIWHQLWGELFDGYLSAYDARSREEFKALFDDFHDEFYKGLSQQRVFHHKRNLHDQRQLKRLGPSMRRHKIKHEQLAQTFVAVRARKLKKFRRLNGETNRIKSCSP